MYSTAKELRFKTKELLESVSRGEEVIITFRGKPYAKLTPFDNSGEKNNGQDELFGIWQDRTDLDDVASYVRSLRKERFL